MDFGGDTDIGSGPIYKSGWMKFVIIKGDT